MPEPTRLLSRELSQDYRPNRRTPAVTAKTIFVLAWSKQPGKDRRAHRLPRHLRRLTGQRRQHGELRLLPSRANRQGGLGYTQHGVCEGSGRKLRVYCSSETHTWIQKATDLGGLGTESIRWIANDSELRMDVSALCRQIEADTVNTSAISSTPQT